MRAFPSASSLSGTLHLCKHCQSYLQESGNVTRLDLTEARLPSHVTAAKFDAFGTKIAALFATSFQIVLMLDADNLPLASPSRLLSVSALKPDGNIFWPDLFQRKGLDIVPDEIYTRLELVPPWNVDTNFHHTESGQFVMDRWGTSAFQTLEHFTKSTIVTLFYGSDGRPRLCQYCQSRCYSMLKDLEPLHNFLRLEEPNIGGIPAYLVMPV